MLVSGWRIAEACALDVDAVNWRDHADAVEAIDIRVKGWGIVRQEFSKTEKSWRVTPLPASTIAMLARRRDRLSEFTTILFPTIQMKLRDPSKTQRESRDILGYPELSTHSFRKTVATILDRAGLSATEIADYLGHEDPSLTMGGLHEHSERRDQAGDGAAGAAQGPVLKVRGFRGVPDC